MEIIGLTILRWFTQLGEQCAPIAWRTMDAIRKAKIALAADDRWSAAQQTMIVGGVRTATMREHEMVKPDRLTIIEVVAAKGKRAAYLKVAAEYTCRMCGPRERDAERARPDAQDADGIREARYLSGYEIAEHGAILCASCAAKAFEARHPEATKAPRKGDSPTDAIAGRFFLIGVRPETPVRKPYQFRSVRPWERPVVDLMPPVDGRTGCPAHWYE